MCGNSTFSCYFKSPTFDPLPSNPFLGRMSSRDKNLGWCPQFSLSLGKGLVNLSLPCRTLNYFYFDYINISCCFSLAYSLLRLLSQVDVESFNIQYSKPSCPPSGNHSILSSSFTLIYSRRAATRTVWQFASFNCLFWLNTWTSNGL